MAKKFVRGITDVKTITNQDFDTNNVNDLLSDGQYNYIHRKKGKNEEYHNLTDNIKTISSDNTELLSVTNYNKTTNTATLHPKHDKQKEQLLESTRDTITINHGTNGTAEKTTVDTNPEKVLEHENLISDSEYITLNHQQGENTTHIKTAALKQELNNLHETKQDVLTAGTGITIEGQTISATGGAHDSQKEQVIESTRDTVNIQHGTNGTAEKTTVDTNPKKVLEHENLISDSEYITLNHETGENTTHIQTAKLKEKLDNLQQNKQDVLVAGSGITIDGQTISAIGLGLTLDTIFYAGEDFSALRQNFKKMSTTIFETFTFDCKPQFTERELGGNVKRSLEKFVRAGMTVSSGSLTITNDGTNMKLIKSGASENVYQQGTFTFFDAPNTV